MISLFLASAALQPGSPINNVPRRTLLQNAGVAAGAAALSALGVPASTAYGGGAVDMGSLLDDFEPVKKTARGEISADERARTLAAANKAEAAKQAARAETAIARMKLADEAKARADEAAANSGLPPCEDSVWGSGQTSIASAKACLRKRDGSMESKSRSGAFLIF